MKRRKHSAETKTKAVLEAIKEEQTIAEVASKYDVHPKLLAQWKQEFVEKPSVAGDKPWLLTRNESYSQGQQR